MKKVVFLFPKGGFSFFFCPNKRKTKQKENSPSAFFCLLRYFFPLKKKNSLRSNSFFFLTLQKAPTLHGKKKRPDLDVFWGGEETTSLRSLEWMFLCMSPRFFGQSPQQLVFTSFRMTNSVKKYIIPFSYHKIDAPQTAKRIWMPMGFRHLVEERKENRANFREEQKAVWATASSFCLGNSPDF